MLAKFGSKSKTKKPARRAVSKYAGVTPAEDRDPVLEEGMHQLRVVSTEEFDGESNGGRYFKATLEIVGSSKHEEGERRAFLQCVTKGNPLRVGGPKVMSFVQHAAGFADFGEFCEDKGGEEEAAQFVDACGGDEDACEVFGENPLEGKILNCRASKNGDPKVYDGKEVQFYNYAWSVPDDEEEEEKPAKSSKKAKR